jgi:hypothetical protein
VKIAFVVLAFCFLGCSSRLPPKDILLRDAQTILRDGTEFELFSIDPADYECLGSTMVENHALQKQIANSIVDAMREEPITAACFEPRHSIKVKHNGKLYCIVICFHCRDLQWWCGKEFHTFPISDSPQVLLDEILTKAGVPLAKKPKFSFDK